MTPSQVRELGDLFDDLRVKYGRDLAIEAVARMSRGGNLGLDLEPCDIPPPARRLFMAVLQHYRVTLTAVRTRRAMNHIRSEAIYVTRQAFPGLSYPMWARWLGRDQSSISVGVKAFEARLASDDLLRARIARLAAAGREGQAAA